MKNVENNENLITKTTEKVVGQWFEKFIVKLIEYKEKNGDFSSVTQDKEIGVLVHDVRRAYKGKSRRKLTPEMIYRLEEIGFTWVADKKVRRKWFNPFYEKVIAYKENNGSFYGITQDNEIGLTVQNVRRAYKGEGMYKLTPEMIQKLEEIEFPWEADIKDYHAKWFPEFFEKLVAYKEKHGDFYKVTKDKEIGSTVHNLRKAYWGGNRGYKLTPDIIEQLESIGFTWEYGSKDRQKWFDDIYKKLIIYKEKNGNFSGTRQDKELSSAVRYIRNLYKDKEFDKFPAGMIEKLNSIGFPWEAEYGNWFEPFYEKLVEYKNSHNGTFKGVTQDKEIGLKVSSVRKAYNGKGQYRLTQEMIDKLNEIDFPWSVRPSKTKEDELSV